MKIKSHSLITAIFGFAVTAFTGSQAAHAACPAPYAAATCTDVLTGHTACTISAGDWVCDLDDPAVSGAVTITAITGFTAGKHSAYGIKENNSLFCCEINTGGVDDIIIEASSDFTGFNDVIKLNATVNGTKYELTPNSGDEAYVYARGGNDIIEGSDNRDNTENLFGEDGNDTINGLGGDDYIEPGNGVDTITGGSGINEIDGFGTTSGPDTVTGGSSLDIITGSYDDDIIDGGGGNNFIYPQDGMDTVTGGAGMDYIDGSGSTGPDTYYGNGGSDVLLGSVDDDFLDSGAGSGEIRGLEGNDILRNTGGAGTKLYGGAGEDVLCGGSGTEWMFGEGEDDIIWDGDSISNNDQVNCGDGIDDIFGDISNPNANCEGAINSATPTACL